MLRLSLAGYDTRAGRGQIRTRVRLFGLWTPLVRVRAEPVAWRA